jgi:hypothetical protein
MPNGIAISTATAVTDSVPTIGEAIPPSRPILRGISVRKLQLITGKPLYRINTMMEINTPITKTATDQITPFAIFWFVFELIPADFIKKSPLNTIFSSCA